MEITNELFKSASKAEHHCQKHKCNIVKYLMALKVLAILNIGGL
jgi:hypothetical protein